MPSTRQRRNLKPGRQKSLLVPRRYLLGLHAADGPRGRPIPQDGHRSRRQVWSLHHSWRLALTQCRARFHALSILSDGRVRSQVPSSRHGDWSLPTFVADARGSLSYSLAGSGRFCVVLVCALRAQTYRFAAAMTLRIDLAARVPSRAVERLISPTHRTFGPRSATASMVSRWLNLHLASSRRPYGSPALDLAGRTSERAPLAGVPPWICCRCLQWQPP